MCWTKAELTASGLQGLVEWDIVWFHYVSQNSEWHTIYNLWWFIPGVFHLSLGPWLALDNSSHRSRTADKENCYWEFTRFLCWLFLISPWCYQRASVTCFQTVYNSMGPTLWLHTQCVLLDVHLCWQGRVLCIQSGWSVPVSVFFRISLLSASEGREWKRPCVLLDLPLPVSTVSVASGTEWSVLLWTVSPFMLVCLLGSSALKCVSVPGDVYWCLPSLLTQALLSHGLSPSPLFHFNRLLVLKLNCVFNR